MIKKRTEGKDDELRAVNLKKYASIGRSAFNLNGRGKVIAIVRTAGAIVGGGMSPGNAITSSTVISQLRALQKNKRVAAIVLRVDSPGGDALASDLMWREISKLSEEKPVIASMADVAASGRQETPYSFSLFDRPCYSRLQYYLHHNMPFLISTIVLILLRYGLMHSS